MIVRISICVSTTEGNRRLPGKWGEDDGGPSGGKTTAVRAGYTAHRPKEGIRTVPIPKHIFSLKVSAGRLKGAAANRDGIGDG